jgi:PIN domain nuclease of toxin-antitoxin system
MRLLLDTHVLIWALIEPQRLAASTQHLLEDAENVILFSAASIWEIAIKISLGRADFQIEPSKIVDAAVASGFTELPVQPRAALYVSSLPPHHRDPFDRLLIAQAMTEPALFYTADRQLDRYSELVRPA